MSEVMAEMEPNMEKGFIGTPTDMSMVNRCIDGRKGSGELGPEIIGGSAGMIVTHAIITDSVLDENFVRNDLRKLKEAGIGIGGHRDSHAHIDHEHPENSTSGCGFADNLPSIISTIKEKREEVTQKITDLGKKKGLDTNSLPSSYDFFSKYDLNKIQITGARFINLIEEFGGPIDILEGTHEERAAYVNFELNTTLNTPEMNRLGKPAFNLDMWAANEQGVILTNANVETLTDLNMVMYQGTEMVLVEQKGKPALPVILHK
jgi:hypothetical protein